MILELDIGNSRIKWRTLAAQGQAVARGSCSRKEVSDGRMPWGDPLSAPGLRRIRVSNVAGPEIAADLDRWARDALGIAPEYARATGCGAGVTSGYREPAKLGVDRWLALLAAWHELSRACVVADAGTAVTVDVLDGSGVHQGGYIVPGLTLMLNALLSGTSGVRLSAGPVATLAAGTCTSDAVLRGGTAMTIALIERTRSGLELPLVLTGGDADLLAPWLAEPTLLRPELVLDGLGLALP
ncbi:MAG: type III pantothenate kinase [Gammaproteobacteria bacterium]|nr:type III pantothenate kinase [Gammaproteobacteria bacterium]MBK9425943.1 type III pantothenate kinase [Gammaproteobacteria bacterium]